MALGAEDIGGKVLAIFFPIMAFVAMGFDHVVANMFFLPAAIFAGSDVITWGDTLRNWLLAFLGNLVGAAVFVSGFYWYLYGRADEHTAQEPGDTPRDRDGRARFTREDATAASRE
jgi:formate/nitrite transporter FocA (FNT family)